MPLAALQLEDCEQLWAPAIPERIGEHAIDYLLIIIKHFLGRYVSILVILFCTVELRSSRHKIGIFQLLNQLIAWLLLGIFCKLCLSKYHAHFGSP